MKKITIAVIVLLSFMVACAHAEDSSEKTKIEYLIACVEALKGAKFIRNGWEYDAQTASNHLRLKLKTAGAKVRTAQDFINLCASQSSMTGEPYLIRLSDGTTMKSEAFFKDRLKAFTMDR
jgi:hypothetical protein